MTVSKHWEPQNILIPTKPIIGDCRNQASITQVIR
jgi:hypothetical protein